MPEEKVKCKECGKEFVKTEANPTRLCPKCYQKMIDTINEG